MISKDSEFKNIDRHLVLMLKKNLYSNKEVNRCPHCKSSKFIKYGKASGIQRFKCKECKRTFSEATNSIWSYSKKNPEKWIKFIELMLEQKVLRQCAECLDININTAFLWRHKVLRALVKIGSSTVLDGAIHMIKTSTKENFKGNKNIKTDNREKVFVVSAKTENDLMISTPICKNLWSWRIFEDKIFKKITEKSYIIPYIDRYVYLAAKRYNNGKLKIEYQYSDLISNFNKVSRNWFKTFYGVATKYLEEYLSWFILFCRDKLFNDIDLTYELIGI